MLRPSHILLGLLLPILANGQSFKFRHYIEQDGLSSRYVYSINQDEEGYLLVGTSEGLFRFDGFQFSSFTTLDSLADNLIECSLTLPDGSSLFGHNNGNLTHCTRGRLTTIRLEQYFNSRITDIELTDSGDIWVSSQNDGLIKLDKNWRPTHYPKGLEEYHVFCILPFGSEFWIGTDMGLVRASAFSPDGIQTELIDGIPLSSVTDLIRFSNDALLIGTEDAGIFEVILSGNSPAVIPMLCTGEDLSQYFIKQLRVDAQDNLWICTNSMGLIQLSQRDRNEYHKSLLYNEDGDRSLESVRVSFQDREQNLWIGTIGQGLAKLEDDYFSTFVIDRTSDPTVHSLFERRDSLWIGLTGKVAVCSRNPGEVSELFGAEHGLPDSKCTSIHVDQVGVLWVGTIDRGLWKQDPRTGRFKKITLSEDLLNQKINALISEGNLLYVATDFGAYVIRNEEVLMHLSIENGLSGNVIRCFFKDSRNRIWIGTTTSGITYIENGEIRTQRSPLPNSSFPARCFTEDQDGQIWMGTEGVGVILLTGEKSKAFLKASGLYSDFCYSLICDDKNRLWIGQRGAVSQVDLKDDKVTIKTPGVAGEVYFQDNVAIRITGGSLLFGTNFGMLRYDSDLDKVNTFEPILNIHEVYISEELVPHDKSIRLKAGDYKIDISFVGISLTRASGVNYQFMLEGYDDDWTELSTQNKATYNHLPPGSYVFKVKAFNSDGIGGTIIKQVEISIDRPYWQQWWFVLICLLILFLIIRIIILRRERFLKQNQEYLKKELGERTKEVVEQKELLEIKNKDITDSIIYAKNIQKAMLPPIDALSRLFSDAFVYFKPKDIVSGDFYWTEQIGSKTIVACADCTGHGVPGAFMSLIGSILLKDIAFNSEVASPDLFLQALHRELYNLLNRKMQEFSLEDGMDITIAEYDTSTGKLRFASANRPVLIYRQGKCLEIRGDRKTVGGGTNYSEESFTLHEFDMTAGDSVYLFSDGITDQFGGLKGKKLKRTGLRSLLDEINLLEMQEQRQIVKKWFAEWRGTLPQLDDVILIGLRI